jgi:hypothetical protein
VGGECRTHRRVNKCVHNFAWKARRDHLKDQDIDGRIILQWILGKLGLEGMD